MRQYLIVSRTYLILSVINLALAAPLVIREGHEVRVDVDVAKDGTAASQTLSRWDLRDTWSGSGSGSNENDRNDASSGPEPSEQSIPEPAPNSPGSETGSNHNSPSRSSTSTSSIGSPNGYPPPNGWDGMASHDAIANGDQLLLPPNGWDHALAEANPSSADHSPPHQTPTETSLGSISPGHAVPQRLFDDPPPRTLTSSDSSNPIVDVEGVSSSHSYSTGSGSTSSGSTSSGSTNWGSTSSGSTSSSSTSSTRTSSGSTGSGSTGSVSEAEAEPVETFLRKLSNGRI